MWSVVMTLIHHPQPCSIDPCCGYWLSVCQTKRMAGGCRRNGACVSRRQTSPRNAWDDPDDGANTVCHLLLALSLTFLLSPVEWGKKEGLVLMLVSAGCSPSDLGDGQFLFFFFFCLQPAPCCRLPQGECARFPARLSGAKDYELTKKQP